MKPSTRIEEIEEELKKQYAPLGNSGEYTTAQVIRINSRAIIQYLDEQAESQEPKALEEKPYICGGQRHDDYPCDQCVPAKPQEALEEKLAECDCNGMHEGNCPDPRVAKPQEEPEKCCSSFNQSK